MEENCVKIGKKLTENVKFNIFEELKNWMALLSTDLEDIAIYVSFYKYKSTSIKISSNFHIYALF